MNYENKEEDVNYENKKEDVNYENKEFKGTKLFIMILNNI